MTERIILTLLAFAALGVALCVLDAVLALWFDADMRRKPRRREPWGEQ